MQFGSRAQVRKYLGGKTVRCLLCGQRFQRLGGHLRDRHEISVDIYKCVFGIPWTQSLASKPSRKRSSATWNEKRKAKARRIAQKTRFFERAHLEPRRDSPAYVLRELTANLKQR